MVTEGVGAVNIPFNANHTKEGSEVVLAVEDRRSQEIEAYRALRTTLLFGRHGEVPARRVLVTSPNQGEGKTTTSANLAVTMANSGRRVVLVDCDLRRPRVHTVFDLPNDIGLVSVVRDGTPLQDALRIIDLDDGQHLAALPAGPVSYNPAELLMGRTVAAIIDKLAERYDCVIIDSSPLRAVADALPLANQVDGVILIARAGATRRRDISEALMQLDLVSANLLAMVVSQVLSKDGQYGSYYGYYGASPTPGPGQRPADGNGDGATSSGIVFPARENRGPSKTKS